jgi:gamma-glutamyltranspeptidase/glutathione hydrolase
MAPDRRDFLWQAATAAAAMTVPRGAHAMAGPPDPAGGAPDGIVTPYFGRKPVARGRNGVVVTSSPHATRAAVELLRAGGNACDAALCASITQCVTEPHMTTITGMLSMLYYDAATGRYSYCNGGVNAPLAPLPGFNPGDLQGGRGVGVPSFWAACEAARARHGTRPVAELMRPAIRYAREGFPIYPFLYAEMFAQYDTIGRTEAGRRIYMPEGAILPPGAVLRQRELADTLERLQQEGSAFFYQGEFARAYCEVVRDAGGVMTPEDFARFEVRWMEPARGTYRGYDVIGSPPPDNGGTHIIESLNMLELLDLARMGPPTESGETLYWMNRIVNEAFTDGARHTDPATHEVPVDYITSKAYAAGRLRLMRMTPPRPVAPAPPPGSNHVTVVDGRGNVATILHSVMSLPWSNGLFAMGASIAASGAHFFRVMPSPGGRGTLYVAPTIIARNGRPVLAAGSPSVGLLQNIVQNTVNILDFGIPIEESVLRPRFGGPNPAGPGTNYIEVDLPGKVRAAAERLGARWHVTTPWHFMNGTYEGIHLDPATGVAAACADPRRCGMAEAV